MRFDRSSTRTALIPAWTIRFGNSPEILQHLV